MFRKGCPRAFFFQYYADSEPCALKAKLLKKLSTPDLVAGQVVDWYVNEALNSFRDFGVVPTDLGPRAVRAFKRFIESSPQVISNMRKGMGFPRDAQPLHHDFYGYDTDPALTARCEEKIANCLYNFEISEVLERIKEVPPSQWSPPKYVGDISAVDWMLGNIRVWSAVDFYMHQDDCLFILDWKSGRRTPESVNEARAQLGAYALYGHRALGYPLERIYTQIVFLQSIPLWEPTQVSALEMADAERLMVTQFEAERAEVVELEPDAKGRTRFFADAAKFGPEPDRDRCFDCNFRKICAPGAAEVSKSLLANSATLR